MVRFGTFVLMRSRWDFKLWVDAALCWDLGGPGKELMHFGCGTDVDLWRLEGWTVVGRIMPSPRCPHPNPWNLWICYITWQKGIKSADTTKFVNELTLRWESHLDFLGGLNLITWIFKSGRRVRGPAISGLDPLSLALKMVERGHESRNAGSL